MPATIPAVLLAFTILAAPAPAAKDAAALTALLHEFLAGASVNDAAIHDRFWADDLIYTGSGGRRIGKQQLMADVRGAAPPAPGDPTVTYSSEDVRIQQYGDAALVAFRLVATSVAGDSTSVSRYLNSGMFVKRGGRWQVVGWQATKLP